MARWAAERSLAAAGVPGVTSLPKTPLDTEMPVAAAATPEYSNVVRTPVRSADFSGTSRCLGTYFSRLGTKKTH